jgi:hypothetical protein
MVSPKIKTASSKLNIADSTPDSIVLRQVKLPGMKRSLTTPEVYKSAIYAIWGGTVLLAATMSSAVMSQRHAVEEVGFNTTPSIYHAQRIRDSVSDLDANVVNMLLLPPGASPAAEKGYQERKEKLSKLLVQVARNITIPVEQEYISKLIVGTNNYIEKAQQARDFHAQNNTVASLQVYREAQKIIGDEQSGLLKDAYLLDNVNFKALNTAYQSGQSVAIGRSLSVLAAGAVLLALLITTQLCLAKWNHRTLNLALLGATLIAAFSLLDTMVSLTTATKQLEIAKSGAFDSLHALRQARSIAYILNTAESRYLLDSRAAGEHEKDFAMNVKKMASIDNLDPITDAASYQSKLQAIANRGKSATGVTGINGFFGTQLNNITFPGELVETQAMITDFVKYLSIDSRIRSLNTMGKREDAIKLTIGNNPGDSNHAFEQFKQSHDRTMDVNRSAFNESIKKAQRALDDPNPRDALPKGETIQLTKGSGFDIFWIKILVITGAIGGLTYFGLMQRIKEYEA